MKKILLFFLVISASFFSCKKDGSGTTNPSQKTLKVNFKVAGFSQQLTDASKQRQVNSIKTDATSNLTSAFSFFHYFAFDAKGVRVSHIDQDSSYADFGNISDNLPAGTYKFLFVGGQSGMNMVYNGYSGYGSIEGYGGSYLPWKDTFYQSFDLTVTSGEVNQSVTLKRIFAQLSINLLDKIPANASKITLTASAEYENYFFEVGNSGTPQPYTATYIVPASAIGTANFKRTILLSNTTTPFTATITCYDASGKIIGQAIINNITLQANTQTILSGNLFATSTNFAIGLNQDWSSGPISIQF